MGTTNLDFSSTIRKEGAHPKNEARGEFEREEFVKKSRVPDRVESLGEVNRSQNGSVSRPNSLLWKRTLDCIQTESTPLVNVLCAFPPTFPAFMPWQLETLPDSTKEETLLGENHSSSFSHTTTGDAPRETPITWPPFPP